MIVLSIVLVFMVFLGAFTLMYQIFKLTMADAESRGLKHPKFWGFFSLSGSNGCGGLLLYLLGRKKYTSDMSDDQKNILSSRKKRAGISLCFIAFGTVGLIIVTFLGNM